MPHRIFKRLQQNEIIRRYIVLNSFDGALTMLGIIIASFFAGVTEARIVFAPGLGAAIALCVSGIWGAYATESAETKRSTKELEKHMMKKLHGTLFVKKKYKMAIKIAIINGLTPLLVSLAILSPFLAAQMGLLQMAQAYYASLAIVTFLLFLFGAFSGSVAKENPFMHGFRMLLAGLVIGLIFYALFLVGLM